MKDTTESQKTINEESLFDFRREAAKAISYPSTYFIEILKGIYEQNKYEYIVSDGDFFLNEQVASVRALSNSFITDLAKMTKDAKDPKKNIDTFWIDIIDHNQIRAIKQSMKDYLKKRENYKSIAMEEERDNLEKNIEIFDEILSYQQKPEAHERTIVNKKTNYTLKEHIDGTNRNLKLLSEFFTSRLSATNEEELIKTQEKAVIFTIAANLRRINDKGGKLRAHTKDIIEFEKKLENFKELWQYDPQEKCDKMNNVTFRIIQNSNKELLCVDQPLGDFTKDLFKLSTEANRKNFLKSNLINFKKDDEVKNTIVESLKPEIKNFVANASTQEIAEISRNKDLMEKVPEIIEIMKKRTKTNPIVHFFTKIISMFSSTTKANLEGRKEVLRNIKSIEKSKKDKNASISTQSSEITGSFIDPTVTNKQEILVKEDTEQQKYNLKKISTDQNIKNTSWKNEQHTHVQHFVPQTKDPISIRHMNAFNNKNEQHTHVQHFVPQTKDPISIRHMNANNRQPPFTKKQTNRTPNK